MYLDVENMQDQNSKQCEASHALKPLQKIGELIRRSREEKDLSIEDLAGSLRIGQEQLIALENGQEELLPEKVFIKAMVRRVAERLHLDIEVVINEFKTEDITLPNLPETKAQRSTDLQYFNKAPTWTLIIGAIGIATSGLAITFLNNNPTQSIQKLSRPSKILAPKTKAINSSYHIVAPGQTLTTISKFHEIPLKTLIKINDLNNPDKLKVGTKLSLK